MTTISQAGIVYIQQSGSSIQYQSNSTSGSWTTISAWPVTLTNSNIATVLTVQLFTNITISATTVGTGTNGFFRMNSTYITFDGNNNTVTISGVTNYPGLINSNSKSNITVQNVGVLNSGSTLAANSGWVCHTFYGQSAINNIVTNCYSTGAITGQFSGGICGYLAGFSGGSVTISNCYSTGAISGGNAGGICGYRAGDSGSVTITNCYSTGAISSGGGGICGSNAGQSAGSVTITNCYSSGTMTGGSGGI